MARSFCVLAALTTSLFVGCAGEDETESQSADVKVKTESESAWAQYQANIRFALDYQPQCRWEDTDGWRPRVLITGYGRFGSNATNATGQMVSALLPELTYPMTEAPPAGEVDDPAPQTAVAMGTIDLPQSGLVDVCAMVLPVYWDLASVLVLKETESFAPDFVMMNGIAGSSQPLWIELGSVNQAMGATDGSKTLAPPAGSPLIYEAPEEERLRGLRLSWNTVRTAARDALQANAEVEEGGVALSSITNDALLAGYPRPSNTYLCNNVAYTVGYLMDHPGETFRLLEPTTVHDKDAPTGIDMSLTWSYEATPRVFVHWPSRLEGAHIEAAADVAAAMIDAQIVQVFSVFQEDPPSVGSNELAEVAGSSGGTF